MKKIVCLLLALTLAFGLVACGKGKTPSGEQGENSAPATSIKKTVLVDESDVKITALEFVENSLIGPEVKLEIRNKSDKNLVFQVRDAIVNNYMVNGVMSVEVAAGEEARTSVLFSTADLQACGITTIASMELSFRAFDSKNWSMYLNSKLATLNTSAAEGFQYTYNHEGTVLHAENGVKIVAKDPIKQGGVDIYIYNGTEGDITVQSVKCALDGIEIEPQFYEDLPMGKHMVTELIIPEEMLEENGLISVTQITLSFEILDGNGEVIVQTAEMTLNVQQ